MESFVPEVCHEPTQPDPNALIEVEDLIACKENMLGILSEPERWAEGALFVDREFMAIEALRGRKTGFERILGHIEWEGYVRARLFCLEYGDRPATPFFFSAIHKRFLEYQAPKVAGHYASGGYRAVYRGSNGDIQPVRYTESQRKEIQSNPHLNFQASSEDPNAGFMYYKYRSAREHDAAIAEVCDWYNATRKARYMDPSTRGALLERKLIERHVYAYGICGRVARMAMNWSLMMDGESPSAVPNFNADILMPEEQWIAQVALGSERHFAMQSVARLRLPVDPVDFFGVRTHLGALQQLGSQLRPPRLEPGNQHSRVDCEHFLNQLERAQGAPLPQLPQYAFRNHDGQKSIIQVTS